MHIHADRDDRPDRVDKGGEGRLAFLPIAIPRSGIDRLRRIDSMANDRQLKQDEQERFRKILLSLRARLQGDVDQMTDEALNRGGDAGNGNLSSMPIHMADLGTDNFDQEFTLGLIENEQETLDEIEAALVRLADGGFGRCGDCEKPIAKARLQALPYTRYCIECARAHENRVALG